jgi:hypothetical protein
MAAGVMNAVVEIPAMAEAISAIVVVLSSAPAGPISVEAADLRLGGEGRVLEAVGPLGRGDLGLEAVGLSGRAGQASEVEGPASIRPISCGDWMRTGTA